MIQFEPTEDAALLKRIITHPDIWPHVTDDNCGSPEDFEVFVGGPWMHLLVKDEELLGCFSFFQQNSICWEVHTCLFPGHYPDVNEAAGKGVIEHIFQSTACLRIVTNVPGYNRAAAAFAYRCGMKRFGVNYNSYLKGGSVMDQIMLGISKGDTCQ